MALSDRLRDKLDDITGGGPDASATREDIDDALDRARERGVPVAKKKAAAAREAVGDVVDRVPEPEMDKTAGIARRAERAGEVRPPVDVGLHLTGDPRQIESFASTGLDLDVSSSDAHVEFDEDRMETDTREELMEGHAILHGWVTGEPAAPDVVDERTDWSADEIEAEHDRLAGIMDERGYEHDSPMGDVDGDGHPHSFADPFGLGGD